MAWVSELRPHLQRFDVKTSRPASEGGKWLKETRKGKEKAKGKGRQGRVKKGNLLPIRIERNLYSVITRKVPLRGQISCK
jgi:hypothetical protein